MDKLLDKLKCKKTPVIVPIQIESYARKDDCFYNVEDKIANDGGHIVYGWKLHKGRLLDEAERHAVWKSPKGHLIDITPENVDKVSILFIEDDNWVYAGNYSDNIRINTTNNPLVDDYILLNETITKLKQTGKKTSRLELVMLEPVVKVLELLYKYKLDLENFILENNNKDSICYCGEKKKYKDCHFSDIKDFFDELLIKVQKISDENVQN